MTGREGTTTRVHVAALHAGPPGHLERQGPRRLAGVRRLRTVPAAGETPATTQSWQGRADDACGAVLAG